MTPAMWGRAAFLALLALGVIGVMLLLAVLVNNDRRPIATKAGLRVLGSIEDRTSDRMGDAIRSFQADVRSLYA